MMSVVYPLTRTRPSGRDHRRVVVGPLSDQHAPFVETDRIALEMPLPEDAGSIAGLAKKPRPRRLRAVERLGVGGNAMSG